MLEQVLTYSAHGKQYAIYSEKQHLEYHLDKRAIYSTSLSFGKQLWKMNTSVRTSFYFVLCLLSVVAFVTGVPNVRSFYHDHNYPQWLKHKAQKFNPQDYLGDVAEEVPTFFKRKNKNGKIVNAFEEDTWFKIRSRNTGNEDSLLKNIIH